MLLAREISHGSAGRRERDLALQLLARVGLAGHSTQPVELLSGGEQQRVAIARALMGSARIGALDRDNTVQIAQLLASFAHDEDMLVIAGTHDTEFASYADKVIHIGNYGFAVE